MPMYMWTVADDLLSPQDSTSCGQLAVLLSRDIEDHCRRHDEGYSLAFHGGIHPCPGGVIILCPLTRPPPVL
jgi:hypothetical protein